MPPFSLASDAIGGNQNDIRIFTIEAMANATNTILVDARISQIITNIAFYTFSRF